MRHSSIALIAAAALSASAATAAPHLGTPEEARTLAALLVGIIDERGLRAGVEAVYDPAQPFVASRMGVNLFQGSVVIADNREPEMVAAEYRQTEDLTGVPVWPRITAAADVEGDAVLKWYHYDTQDVYDFHCFSKWAERDDVLVMICR